MQKPLPKPAKLPAEPAALEFQVQVVSDVITHKRRIKAHGKSATKVTAHGIYAQGILRWQHLVFEARSGPWGKGSISDGLYTIKRSHFVENPTKSVAALGPDGKPLLDDAGDTVHRTIANEGMRVSLSGGAGSGGGGAGLHDVAFFIPLQPQDKAVHRAGLGIHPDGNVVGTQGCVGIVGADAGRFWETWKATPPKSRPVLLQVSGIGGKPLGALQDMSTIRASTE